MDARDEVTKKFVDDLKEFYKERQIICEEQWPPVRGDKLINLQLVEAEKTEGFRAGLPQQGAKNDKVKRTPIDLCDLFTAKDGKKPVRKLIVEGNGGMGKTTLCTMLTEKWAEGEILTQFDYVLLLPLREEVVSSARSLSDLLKLLHDSESIRSSVTEHIERKKGSGVLIIADGWDELVEDKRSKKSFLYQFLFGYTLRFASVLLTSRPSASAPLHDLRVIDRSVEVVGFNEENIKQYIASECPKNASSLIEQLENHPLLLSVCSIPLNCAIICHLQHTPGHVLPSTLTEFYTQIVLNVILRDIKKKFPELEVSSLTNFDSIPKHLRGKFWLTCKFAYKYLSRNQIVFSKDKLPSFISEALRSGDKFLCFGLLQSARSLLPVGHGLSFHFLHLTIQEFLAALHLVHLPIEEQLKVCKARARSSRFAMVWRFVFGLGSKKQGSHSIMVSSKVVCLEDEVVDCCVSISRSWTTLCHCALESKNDTVSTKIAKEIDGRFDKSFVSTPHDCIAVYHVLRHTSHCQNVRIDLSGCGLSDKHLPELAESLSSSDGALMVRSLSLSDNKLTSKSVSNLLRKASASFSSLKHLELVDSNISDVMTAFMHTSCKNLTTLNLSDNPLGESGIQPLEKAIRADVLGNLWFLKLSNSLTDNAVKNGSLLSSLLTPLASRCPHLRTLELSRNNLGVPGAHAVGQVFPLLASNSNLHLDLSGTYLNGEAARAFSECVVGTSSSLRSSYKCSLHLSDNPLGYDGLLAILRMLRSEACRIENLHLINTSLTTRVSAETDTIDSLPLGANRSLTTLFLDRNNFSGDNFLLLAEFIQVCQSLGWLHCRDCSLTSSEITNLLELLKSYGNCFENLREWTLWGNSIDDMGVDSLIKYVPDLFPKLYNLRLDEISGENAKRLRECLGHDYKSPCPRVQSSHRVDQQDTSEASGPDVSTPFTATYSGLTGTAISQAPTPLTLRSGDAPSTYSQPIRGGTEVQFKHSAQESNPHTGTTTAVGGAATAHALIPSPQKYDSGDGGLKTVTIEELKFHTKLTEFQLDRQVEEGDMYLLARCFENVDDYILCLGLTAGQQTDIKDLAFRRGTQTAMCEALRLWREPNPYRATYHSLLKILLNMGKGSVADQVCSYLSKCGAQ